MTDDRKAGLLLILGSIGGIVTMAIHPHGLHTLTPVQLERLATVSAIAHSLAMVSCLALFLGAIGLMRRLASREAADKTDRLAIAALVTFGFAAVALLIATAVSGFIVPAIVRQMIADKAVNAPQWNIVIDAVFQFNQAFARIYSVAASVSIVLWSASALRNAGLTRFIALYGCIVPSVLICLIFVGHIRLDVHGMGLVVLVHAIWFVVVGAQLYQHPDPTGSIAPTPVLQPE